MGLGNPGPEYEETRHNAGFLLADHLVRRWGFPDFRKGYDARESKGTVAGEAVHVLKPTTYMNLSGAALKPFVKKPDFDPARDLLVLYDDVDTELGGFRLRGAGSPGGHNGLKSIEGALRRQDYPRVRIGIGPKPAGADLAEYVLHAFGRAELRELEALLDPMAEAVETWIGEGIEKAMTKHNPAGKRAR